MADELHDLISDAYQCGYADALEDASVPEDFYSEEKAEGCAQFQADTKDRQAALNARPSPTDADAPEGLAEREERVVACLAASLMGTGETRDAWTFAGMQDAFFRWPVVERELRHVLSAIRHPTADEGDALHGKYHTMLLELLAVIHRDGGHKTQEIGIGLSFKQAMKLSSERIVRSDAHLKGPDQ